MTTRKTAGEAENFEPFDARPLAHFGPDHWFEDLGKLKRVGCAIAAGRSAETKRAPAGNTDALRKFRALSWEDQQGALLAANLPLAVLVDAAQAISDLRRRRPYASLAPQYRLALDAIHYLTGRPSLRLRDGVPYDPPPPDWAEIDDHGAEIGSVAAAVGRIDITLGAPVGLGTGVVVGERLVLTNRHVARLLCDDPEADPAQWTLDPRKRASIAFGYEEQKAPGHVVPIESIVHVAREPSIDLAVLATEAPLPPPVEIETEEMPSEHRVYSIGYPARDSRGDPEVMLRLFGTTFGVKRLAPGRVRDLEGVPATCAPTDVLHDCTTLGGASGSCVMSLSTHKLVALHYGGIPFRINVGVAGRHVAEHLERAKARPAG